MTGCSALNCSNQSFKKRMYRFPKKPERRNKWVINCRRKEFIPNEHSRLCEDHFESCEFEKPTLDGKIRLRKDAIPTLFNLPNPPSPRHRIPYMVPESELIKKKLVDHQYIKRKKRDSSSDVLFGQFGSSDVAAVEHSYNDTALNESVVSSGGHHLVFETIISSNPTDSQSSQCEILISHARSITKRQFKHFGAYEADVCKTSLGRSAGFRLRAEVANKSTMTDLEFPCSEDGETSEMKVKIMEQKLWKLTKNLQVITKKHNNLKNSLKYLHPDQVVKDSGKKVKKWSTEALRSAYHLYFKCGRKGYDLLLKKGFPLPSCRAIYRGLAGDNIKPELCISELINLIEDNSDELMEHEALP